MFAHFAVHILTRVNLTVANSLTHEATAAFTLIHFAAIVQRRRHSFGGLCMSSHILLHCRH